MGFKQVIVLVLPAMLAMATVAHGQDSDPKRYKRPSNNKPEADVVNMPNYDNKKWHFGFFLAINYTGFRVKHSNYFNAQLRDTSKGRIPFSGIEPHGTPGFTTGFIVNRRIGDLWDLRVMPQVSFYQRIVDFHYIHDTIPLSAQLNQSTFSFIEVPIQIKFKSVRRRNTRMFLTAGVKPGMEVGAKRNEIAPDQLRATSFDCAVEYGFGLDLYYPLFKFSPELRFSHGLINMVNPDDNYYANSIARMYTHTVTLYLHFN